MTTAATWAGWRQCHTLLGEWDRDRDPLTLHALADALEEAGYARAKGLHVLADRLRRRLWNAVCRKRLGQRLRRVREWLYGTAAGDQLTAHGPGGTRPQTTPR